MMLATVVMVLIARGLGERLLCIVHPFAQRVEFTPVETAARIAAVKVLQSADITKQTARLAA